jgi:hypothetical protein
MKFPLIKMSFLAALLLITSPVLQTAKAGQISNQATAVPQQQTDLSAQKRTVKKKRVYSQHRARPRVQVYQGDPTRSPYYLRPGVAPSFGYVGPPGYAGEYAWRRSIGQCVEDLGYGRWAPCGSR